MTAPTDAELITAARRVAKADDSVNYWREHARNSVYGPQPVKQHIQALTAALAGLRALFAETPTQQTGDDNG